MVYIHAITFIDVNKYYLDQHVTEKQGLGGSRANTTTPAMAIFACLLLFLLILFNQLRKLNLLRRGSLMAYFSSFDITSNSRNSGNIYCISVHQTSDLLTMGP